MRKALLLAIAMILLPINGYTTPAFGNSTLEDCRKIGNNASGSVTRFEDGGHIEDWSNFLKPQGKLRTLIIPIDFSDAPHVTSLGSIKEFGDKIAREFTKLSNSKLNLEISITSNWIRMPRDGKYYVSANWTEKINDALDAANSEVDFSKFELILIKVDEKNSPIDSAGALPMWGEHLHDGIKVLRGAFLGNDFWTKQGQGVQVAVHEIGHVFGLPDLYQRNSNGQFPVGIYDLMSTFRLQYELNLLGWNKWKLGWLDESKLKCISIKNPSLLAFPRDKTNWDPVFIPYEDRVLGIEMWSNAGSSNEIAALIYEVTPKTYVWASNRESGAVSPIQLLRPQNSNRLTAGEPEINGGAKFLPGDSVQHFGVDFRFMEGGKDFYYVSITPAGQETVEIPLSDKQVEGLSSESSTKDNGSQTVAGKSNPEPKPKVRTVVSKVTITCAKGKLSKKVTAVKPLCPSGYKKKK
jgi:M6 family metalloprotease-like protein